MFIAAQRRQEKGEVVFGGLCTGLFIGLIGGAFIFVGIQAVLGSARDTLGNATNSLSAALTQIEKNEKPAWSGPTRWPTSLCSSKNGIARTTAGFSTPCQALFVLRGMGRTNPVRL